MSNLLPVSAPQLKKALTIRKKIDALTAQMDQLLGGRTTSTLLPKKTKRIMPLKARRKIAAAAKARWAKAKAEGKNRL